MKLQQIRSATLLLTLGDHVLLVDPMLGDAGSMPGFRYFRGRRRRNPLVELPKGSLDDLARATGAIVTHEHPDHLDAAGRRFLRERRLPVWTNGVDAPSLSKKGLDVRVLEDGALGMRVETIRSRHARGPLGWALGPVSGYFLAHPDEPSVYLVGDSVLTHAVEDAVQRLRPDVLVLPAGAANLGLGGDILFSVDEVIALAKLTAGHTVMNHLEALDHCPTQRDELRARLNAEGLANRSHVPDDGEVLELPRPERVASPELRSRDAETPGFQKWITARLFAS